jgi:hypothetical protein
MQATVREVLPPRVRFDSPYGGGLAVWKGKTVAIGATSDVEVDVDEVVPADRIRRSSPGERPGFRLEDGLMILRGAVEQIDEDGIATFRIGPDCMISAEPPKEVGTPGLALVLRVAPERLSLWPYAL